MCYCAVVNHLEPRTSHPFLWILLELLGLNLQEIAARSGISRAILRQARDGYTVKPAIVKALHKAVRKAADEVGSTVSPAPVFPAPKLPSPYCFWHLSPEIYQHRIRTFKLINLLLTQYATPATPPRETDMSGELLVCIGRGQRRSLVLSMMANRPPKSVKKAAKRVGVREELRDGVRWWLPPTDVTPIKPPKPPRVPQVFKSSPRARKIQIALQTFLYDYPTGVSSQLAETYVRERADCSRAHVYKAARELAVVRETHGFGKDKTTTWALPPVVKVD